MRDDDSGWKWGPFEIWGAKPWSLRIQQRGGTIYYPYHTNREKQSQHLRAVNQQRPIIVKGNHVGDFTHPRLFEQTTEWYYWDNCLLPQLMQPNVANPSGSKIWTRLVYQGVFPGRFLGTESDLEQAEHRVNRLIQAESGGLQVRWQDIVKIRPLEAQPQRRLLFCLPSLDIPWLYYHTAMNTVLESVRQTARDLDYELIIRHKPARQQRRGAGSIDHELEQGQYCAVIGIHSAIGIEVTSRLVPYIALGQHSLDTLAWSLEDLREDRIQSPDPQQVLQRQRELLLTTRSKTQELLTGTWSLDNDEKLLEPRQDWRLEL